MAAGEAAQAGARTLLIEKMRRSGRKLRISGKGRCNLTNMADLDDFLAHFRSSGESLRYAFSQYFAPDVMRFFESLGVKLVTERGGRVFPASGNATDIVDAMVKWVARKGCKILTASPVDLLIIESRKICGVKVGKYTFKAPAVVLATGGASYPLTGSTGDGYRLAAEAGHNVHTPRPALVPLEVREPYVRDLNGLNLRNINMRVLVDDRFVSEYFGELTFTDFGVAGPVILTASKDIIEYLHDNKQVVISIDLKPALSSETLEARLVRDFAKRGTEPTHSIMRGLLPRQLIHPCLEATGINGKLTGNAIKPGDRKRLLEWLKNFRLTVSGHRPLDEAIVTAGGVDMNEINSETMESRLIKGLFFAGELLDIDADTGGYNLQAAFSTGWLAGRKSGERRAKEREFEQKETKVTKVGRAEGKGFEQKGTKVGRAEGMGFLNRRERAVYSPQ